LRFSTRTFSLAFVTAGAAALALGLALPAGAQSIPGPLKVTDSGPSYPTGAGYAIKGITGFANNAGVFGYGTVASSAINIDGVVGYVQTQQSVGVVGWSASTGTQAYGVFGHSDTGPGVYGFNNNGGAPSIYGLNSSTGGTAMYGLGDNGVVGITAATSAAGSDAGVTGMDSSTAGANFGVAGTTVNAVGSALFGNALNGGTGADVNSDNGFGMIADSSFGTGAEVLSGQTGGLALIALPSGEGLISFGFSGGSSNPALNAVDGVGGTDLIGTYGFNGGGTPNETFIVQAGTANASGIVPANSSDTQVSGDLYVGGNVYADCALGGTFPAASSGCSADLGPTVKVASNGAAVRTYRPRESIPTIEDFGEARLTNGQTVIPLERTFAQTIDTSRPYLVFITSESENRGLYVTNRTAAGFTVREMAGGQSASAFEYRIVAHPRGSTSVRLAAVPATTAHVAMRAGRFGNAMAIKAAALRQRPKGVHVNRSPQRLKPPTVNLSPG
jgi:hypothetical protein